MAGRDGLSLVLRVDICPIGAWDEPSRSLVTWEWEVFGIEDVHNCFMSNQYLIS